MDTVAARRGTLAWVRTNRHFVLFAAALTLGLMWAVASPVGSSPDDDFHLASIWCASGRDDLCTPDQTRPPGAEAPVLVPAEIAGWPCFATHPEQSGACAADLGLQPTPGRANGGLYPPTFYWVLSWLASPHIWLSVMLMRIVALLGCLGAWCLTAWAAPALRDSQLLAWSVGAVPMGMFVAASTNPSSWALAGLTALWPAVWTLFDNLSGPARAKAAAAALVAAVLASSRADSALMGGALITLIAVLRFRGRAQRSSLAISASLGAVLLLVYATSKQNDAVAGEMSNAGADFSVSLLWRNIGELPGLWAGAFGHGYGYFGALGWSDTAMPALVWLPMLLIVGGLGFVGVQLLRRTKLLLLLGVLGMAVVLPMYVLSANAAVVGSWVQGRYLLPLVVVLLAVTLAPLGNPGLVLWPSQRHLVVIGATLAASMALHTQLRRYVTGLDVASPNLDAGWQWWDLPVLSPTMVWVIGTVAAVVVFTITTAPFGPERRSAGAVAATAEDRIPAG